MTRIPRFIITSWNWATTPAPEFILHRTNIFRARSRRTEKNFSGNKPLPLDYCLEVGSQLAHALLYLHSKNLTHRDIKPANVIFVNGRPKLADIGLVAHLDQRSFVGTEGFVPPDGPGTRRADVYALAKVLYEISTGKDRMDFPELPDDLPEGTVRKMAGLRHHHLPGGGTPH